MPKFPYVPKCACENGEWFHQKKNWVKLNLICPSWRSVKSHGVIPQFLNFKVTNQRLKNSAAYRQCQYKLLDEEIFNKHCRICELTTELSTTYSNLANLVSSLDLVHLKTLSESENSKQLQRHEKIQEKKLFRLSVSTANTGCLKKKVIQPQQAVVRTLIGIRA